MEDGVRPQCLEAVSDEICDQFFRRLQVLVVEGGFRYPATAGLGIQPRFPSCEGEGVAPHRLVAPGRGGANHTEAGGGFSRSAGDLLGSERHDPDQQGSS